MPNPKRVFVSVVVDDLDARCNPNRSDRYGVYRATAEEIHSLLDLIAKLNSRLQEAQLQSDQSNE